MTDKEAVVAEIRKRLEGIVVTQSVCCVNGDKYKNMRSDDFVQ